MHIESALPGIRRRLTTAAALLALTATAHAVDVGPLRLLREGSQPLRAEIAVTDKGSIAASDLRVRIAARETFEVAGLRYHPALNKVQIQSRQAQPGRVILVLDGLPTDTPRLDLLITVSDRASLTIAEYRLDTQAVGTEFPAARAGSSLAERQRSASSPTAEPTPPSGAAARTADAVKAADAPKAPTATPAATVAPAARPASGATPAPDTAGGDPRAALTAAIQAWAQAWSRKDVKAYLDSYAKGFVSADPKLSYPAWAEQRRQRILARKSIEVRVEGLALEPKGKDWIASFEQHYRGDERRETSRKQLLLRQIDGRWLIIGEREAP